MQIVLASTSIYRSRILESAGLEHECVDPGVDESAIAPDDPVERAVARARAKALAVRREGSCIIAADQVLYDPVRAAPFGKPTGPRDHFERLASMRGCAHQLHTAWVVRRDETVHAGVETSTLHVRADVTDDEIAAYVRSGEGAGCAGGYAAEGRGGFLVERVDGDWTNVIGLPIFRVMDALRALGWRFGGAR